MFLMAFFSCFSSIYSFSASYCFLTNLSATDFLFIKEICQFKIALFLLFRCAQVFLLHSLSQMVVEEVEYTVSVYQVLIQG